MVWDFELGGVRYTWSAKRYAGKRDAASDFRGLSARVTLAEGVFRELVIDFPPEDPVGQGAGSARHLEARLIACTEKAIEAGWRPESRGKPYRVAAVELEA